MQINTAIDRLDGSDSTPRMRCVIVQQSVWHMAKESMPLAAGYVVAALRSNKNVSEKYDCDILNFSGEASPLEMALKIVDQGVPHVIGFSVLGWNYNQFIKVSETLKQFNSECLIILGGNHVSNQAEKVFCATQAVDIVVNGEGDFTMVDILNALPNVELLSGVPGISYVDKNGNVHHTEVRPRILDLDEIPSPILSGAIPLSDDQGRFRYDVALMETNRGCPYSCAFCYWGGATGQKVRSFSIGRLRSELEYLVREGAETIVLCDANFGMLKQDLEFVDAVIEMKAKYGRPKALETSWAKNKNKTFYEIVSKMKEAGLKTSFTIALQSLNEPVLEAMKRKNMGINEWKDLVLWLRQNEMDVYAELIWGAPGETFRSFIEGYDEMARFVSRIATYPMLLLPNTEFGDKKKEYGFKTIKGQNDDFDYVLQSDVANLEEHRKAWRFLFWARLLTENLVMRNLWVAALRLENISQSQMIISFADFVDGCEHPAAEVLRDLAAKSVADPDSLAPALELCFTDQAFDSLVLDWGQHLLRQKISAGHGEFFLGLLKFDLDTRPLTSPKERGFSEAEDDVVDGLEFWIVEKQYDYPYLEIISDLKRGVGEYTKLNAGEEKHTYTMRYRKGFAELVRSTNHEETAHFVAHVYRPSPKIYSAA
ncbi:KedN5 family methylcobalamin-dependent radical SAM C-methyltransferase [Rhizobium sp.]|uniref:KedN5 family methylcobalamin-dependent radical SAM C-methyltransferase n=1 Tax=Rhizobium sp. TaxID=391 RepID=UPI002AA652A9